MNFDVFAASWCDFVLEEGVMPNSIARLLKANRDNFVQNESLYRYIALILLLRERFSTESQCAKFRDFSVFKNAFLSDVELVDWLKKIEPLLQLIVQASVPEMSDAVVGSFKSFIKSCPLVLNENKEKYLSKFFSQDSSVLIKTRARRCNSEMQLKFESYLEQKYTKGTVSGYRSAITTIGTQFLQIDLWNVTSSEEMEKIKLMLDENLAYLDVNIKRHHLLSRAIEVYIDFLKNTFS